MVLRRPAESGRTLPAGTDATPPGGSVPTDLHCGPSMTASRALH